MTVERLATPRDREVRTAFGRGQVRWVFVAVAAAAVALSMAAAGENVLPGDVAVARFVQGWPPLLDPLYAFTNWLGMGTRAIGIAFAGAAVLALRRYFHEATLLLLLPLAWLANASLKNILESPRPTADLVEVTHVTDGFGFPSGHVMGVTVLAALTATVVVRVFGRRALPGAAFAAVLLAFVTALARIDNGAHWPSDVLGGWLWGALVAAALIWGHAAIAKRTSPRSETDRRGQ